MGLQLAEKLEAKDREAVALVFWSESCKTFKDLRDVSPFLLVKTPQEKQKIIQEIKEYFTSQSTELFKKNVKIKKIL